METESIINREGLQTLGASVQANGKKFRKRIAIEEDSEIERSSKRCETRHPAEQIYGTFDSSEVENEYEEDESEQADRLEDKKKGIKFVPLTNAHRKEIKSAYDRMPKQQMWKLSSGTVVEEELYKIGKQLQYEHAVHSFILDPDDEVVQKHFNEADLIEIINRPGPTIPELSAEAAEYLFQFSGETSLSRIREIMNKNDPRLGKGYVRDLYYDLDYIRFALYAIIREIESGRLKDDNLEAWYNCHVWHPIIDQGLGDLNGIIVVRGESTSIATALRKNAHRTAIDRRMVGRRGDWILRSDGNGERDEYGVGEAGKQSSDHFGTKFLKEAGLKAPKALKDMLMKLMRKVEWNPEICMKMQTVGIIHAGLLMVAIFMDRPCGFVCRLQRGEIMEVPDCEEKFPMILQIIAIVLSIKATVRETVKAIFSKMPTRVEEFKKVSVVKKRQTKKEQMIPECMTTPRKVATKFVR